MKKYNHFYKRLDKMKPIKEKEKDIYKCYFGNENHLMTEDELEGFRLAEKSPRKFAIYKGEIYYVSDFGDVSKED